jgi:hypothetical protein
MSRNDDPALQFYEDAWRCLSTDVSHGAPIIEWSGSGALPSVFATTDLAVGSIAAAGAAMAELIASAGGVRPAVTVDRRLASLWFQWSHQPIGWKPAPAWDPIAGDYACSDGFIRLHTNAPHHRAAALRVLGVPPEKALVAQAIGLRRAEELEVAVVQSGGCAAAMRSLESWRTHPQGRAVRDEPLIAIFSRPHQACGSWRPTTGRPLLGLRVLDLTRVLAGPVATRFLAGYGADVLRIDPPDWDEPGVVPEVTPGKRCARLDLQTNAGAARLRELLAGADVLVHGYRADALDRLGLDDAARQAIRPGLIDVTLNAYGWTGPWRNRRGFDSLVQMSAGIADAGMRAAKSAQPKPLPVQALDHATGYLMAAAVLQGLVRRLDCGAGTAARLSLARTADLLTSKVQGSLDDHLAPASDDDWATDLEAMSFGPARRLRPPLMIDTAPMCWHRPACALGSADPAW